MTDEEDVLAGEYALGLLDRSEMATVDAALASNTELVLRIEWWRDRFTPLIDEIAREPSTDLWPRIAAQLPVEPEAANDNAPTLAALRRWRASAISFGGIAAALIAVIVLRPATPVVAPSPVATPATPAAPMVASLAGEKGAAIAVAYDSGSGRILVTPVALDAGKGDAELWIIPEGSATPVSMGVINASQAASRTLGPAQAALVRPGATFAVSLEPKGGSPSAAPTGPIVATGKIIRV